MTVIGITYGRSWVQIEQSSYKHLLLLVGNTNLSHLQQYGPTAYCGFHFPPVLFFAAAFYGFFDSGPIRCFFCPPGHHRTIGKRKRVAHAAIGKAPGDVGTAAFVDAKSTTGKVTIEGIVFTLCAGNIIGLQSASSYYEVQVLVGLKRKESSVHYK